MNELEDNLPNDALDQDNEPAEQDPSAELPTDPDELKAATQKLHAELISVKRQAKELTREVERHKERAEEGDVKSKYWSERYLKEFESRSKPAPKEEPEVTPDPDGKKELADLVSAGLTLDDLRKKLLGDVVTKRDLEERVKQERQSTSQENAMFREIVQDFPDLADPKSELAVAANAEFEKLVAERPGVDEVTLTEMAAARAARRIGYVPGKPKAKEPSDRERLQRAQGGPTGKGEGKAPVVLTDEDRKIARKIGGFKGDGDLVLSEKDMIAIKQKVAQRNRQRASQ